MWRNLLIWAGALGPLAPVIYSCYIHAWTYYAGVYFDADLEGGQVFAGYLGKINWSLTTLWWLLLTMAIYLSWGPIHGGLARRACQGHAARWRR